MQHFGFGGFASAYMYNWDHYRDWHLWELGKYELKHGRGTHYVMRSYYAPEEVAW